MIHKIHMGSSLPSVIAGGSYKIPHNGSDNDFSTVVYPADARRCQSCHDSNSGATQTDAWLTKPSKEACGSCHDNVDFATGANRRVRVQDGRRPNSGGNRRPRSRARLRTEGPPPEEGRTRSPPTLGPWSCFPRYTRRLHPTADHQSSRPVCPRLRPDSRRSPVPYRRGLTTCRQCCPPRCLHGALRRRVPLLDRGQHPASIWNHPFDRDGRRPGRLGCRQTAGGFASLTAGTGEFFVS
jgi:predicted CXXCH cytochrome family protein